MEVSSSIKSSQIETQNKENSSTIIGTEKLVVTVGKFLGIGISAVGVTTLIMEFVIRYIYARTNLLDSLNVSFFSIIIFLVTTVFILTLSLIFTKSYSMKKEIIFISLEIVFFGFIPLLIRIASFGFYF